MANIFNQSIFTSGVVRCTGQGGHVSFHRVRDLVQQGRDHFNRLQGENSVPLPKINVVDVIDSFGFHTRVFPPRNPVLLSEAQAGVLFARLFVQRPLEIDLSDARNAQNISQLKVHAIPAEEARQIEVFEAAQHLRNVLYEIWGQNLAGQQPHGIDMLVLGQKKTSGIGTYLLAEQIICAGLGIFEQDLNMQVFHRILTKEVIADKSTAKNLNYGHPGVTYLDFLRIREFLKNKLSNQGLDHLVLTYGSLRGMVRLAAELDDMNLANLYTFLGSGEKLRELLDLSVDVDLSGWQWKKINLPAASLNELLTYIESIAESFGWKQFIEVYGTPREMVKLAAEHNMNIGHIFSALGREAKFRELLSISESVSMKGWHWRFVNFPSDKLNRLLTEFEGKIAALGWPGFIEEYGTIQKMIDLARKYEVNPRQLFSVFGNKQGFRDFLSLPDDVSLEKWQWRDVGLTISQIDWLNGYVAEFLKEKTWADFIEQYGSALGMLRLAIAGGDINPEHFHVYIGKPQKLRQVFPGMPGDIEKGWKWPHVRISIRAINNIVTEFREKANKVGWQKVISEYGTLQGMMDIAQRHGALTMDSYWWPFGQAEMLRELFNIPDEIDLSGWNWQAIQMTPAQTMKIIERLKERAKDEGWLEVIRSEGSIKSMVRIAREEGVSYSSIASGFGRKKMLQELLGIPGDIDLKDWSWPYLDVSEKSMERIVEIVSAIVGKMGWSPFIDQYGNLRGVDELSRLVKINTETLKKVLGTAEKLSAFCDVPAGTDVSRWNLWK